MAGCKEVRLCGISKVHPAAHRPALTFLGIEGPCEGERIHDLPCLGDRLDQLCIAGRAPALRRAGLPHSNIQPHGHGSGLTQPSDGACEHASIPRTGSKPRFARLIPHDQHQRRAHANRSDPLKPGTIQGPVQSLDRPLAHERQSSDQAGHDQNHDRGTHEAGRSKSKGLGQDRHLLLSPEAYPEQ